MKIHSSSMKSGLTLSSDSILGPLTSDLPAEGLDLNMEPVELTIDNPHVNWGKIDMLMKRFLHIRLRSLQKKIGVIGDGLLTPAISVFSAVSGLEVSMSKKHHQCCDYHYLLHTGVFIFKAAKGLQRQSLPQQLCNFY